MNESRVGMTDEQAVQLYLAMVEATPREASELGPDLWCAAIRHLRFQDAVDGMARLLRRQTWISAADLCQEVAAIRSKRIGDRGIPIPPPGLTQSEERDWQRAAVQRIGDGEEVADGDRGVLVARPKLQLLGRKV